ncbi:MAG: RAMP superfamily CRISPR-associated protein [Pseudonocardiaceae bacterium]
MAVPSNRLTFEVTFHGPVRVGRGRAAAGVDDTVDPEVIVPGSSLKGLMRAEASVLLGSRESALVDEVFGAAKQPSPWHWNDVRAADTADDEVRSGARIRVDSTSGTAVDGGLFSAEYRWPRTARFDVARFTALTDEDRERHELLLWAAALSVHSIGADRNRGYGWVDVTRVDAEPDETFLARVAELMGVRS